MLRAHSDQGVEPALAFLPVQPDAAVAAGAGDVPGQPHVGEAWVDAAVPVRGRTPRSAAQKALHRCRRDGGEQADTVDAVVAQHLGLARGSDAVQGVDRQRLQPRRGLAGVDGQDSPRAGILGGGGGRHRDGRPGPDPHVDAEAGDRTYPQDPPEAADLRAVVRQRPL